jgi:hypothetical protein
VVILVGCGTDKATRTTTRTPQPYGSRRERPAAALDEKHHSSTKIKRTPRRPIAGASQVRREGTIPRGLPVRPPPAREVRPSVRKTAGLREFRKHAEAELCVERLIALGRTCSSRWSRQYA